MIVMNRPNSNRMLAEQRALYLYDQACKKNFLRQFVSALKQEKNELLDLKDVLTANVPYQQHETVKQMVPLTQIQGSASNGRTHDFDSQFRPKTQHTKTRWVNLAAARSMGKKIPPVLLTTIKGIPGLEDVYFVEDGHHRISLANVMGEDSIEAKVTVVHVTGGHA